ncbi:MAG: hypothetical protein JNK38_16625 [Acidobacteria bacterium]|nr:hypothetical protein [Acidobacteriota bacterium]
MRKVINYALFVVGLIVVTSLEISAQTVASLDDKIKQAKEEVQKLDEFIQAASTSDSLKKSLKPVLDNRRAILKDLEQLKLLPVTLRPKELGTVVSNLEDTPVASAAPVTVAVSERTEAANSPCSSPDCGSATGGKRMICGRIRPASMDQTLALIQALPSFRSYVKAGKDGASTAAIAKADEWAKKYGGEDWRRVAQIWKQVGNSKFTSDVDCSTSGKTPGTGSRKNGAQKEAVVDLLHWLLTNRMPEHKHPNYKESQDELKGALGADNRKVSAEVIRRQIALLNEFIGNVKVIARDKDEKLIGNTLSDQDGNFSMLFNLDEKEPVIVSTEGDNNYTTRDVTYFADCNCYKLNIPVEDRPASLLVRAVVGYQQAGAAATETRQNYFFDLFVSKTLPLPFKQKVSPDFGDPVRIWGAIRAISVPQNGDFTLGEGAQTIVTNIPKLKAREAARVFDYLGGIEWRIAGDSSLLPSFDRQTRQKFSLSLIAGLGFITPSTPSEDVPVFEVPPNLASNPKLQKVLDDLGVPKNQKYIAFPRNDRDRFFRQYYGGIRVQTFFFNRHNVPLQRFPAQFDLTVGQNEYVTGGHLRRPVVRFDGYFPLPYEKLEFINLFGTAMLNPNRATESTPLILTEAKDKVFTNADVYLIPTAQFSRDYYRFGVGFDFVSFLKKVMNKDKALKTAAATQQQSNPTTPNQP